MKALGKIGNIEVTYSQEKTSERDGHKFWYERHTVFFESGDDTHMVTVGTHTQGQGGGIEVLKRRGIEIGARGEMTMRYGFLQETFGGMDQVRCSGWLALQGS